MQPLCVALSMVSLLIADGKEQKGPRFSVVVEVGAPGVTLEGDLFLALYASGALRTLGGGELNDRHLKRALADSGKEKSSLLTVVMSLQADEETSASTLAAALSRLRTLSARDTKVVVFIGLPRAGRR